jgi:hypothetical protein
LRGGRGHRLRVDLLGDQQVAVEVRSSGDGHPLDPLGNLLPGVLVLSDELYQVAVGVILEAARFAACP